MLNTTKRSKRLAKYLSEKLDWNVIQYTYKCTNDDCGAYTFYTKGDKYCRFCGKKLNVTDDSETVLKKLEDALKFALKEKDVDKEMTEYSFKIGALNRTKLLDEFMENCEDDYDKHLDSDTIRTLLLAAKEEQLTKV